MRSRGGGRRSDRRHPNPSRGGARMGQAIQHCRPGRPGPLLRRPWRRAVGASRAGPVLRRPERRRNGAGQHRARIEPRRRRNPQLRPRLDHPGHASDFMTGRATTDVSILVVSRGLAGDRLRRRLRLPSKPPALSSNTDRRSPPTQLEVTLGLQLQFAIVDWLVSRES